MTVARDFEEFFASCNRQKVRYLVVGGYALALHAYPRFTGDMDIFVDPAEENARRIIAALGDFGLNFPGLTWEDFTRPHCVVQFGHPPLRIDVMTAIDGVTFGDAWKRRVISAYGVEEVPFISKEDLIINKRASGRKQDLLDLDGLL